jgi:hypothetical protein
MNEPQCSTQLKGKCLFSVKLVRRDSSVGTAKGYGLDGQGSIPDGGRIIFSSSTRPDLLWDPPSLLCNGYRRPEREAI